ncbi:MAG: Gfo/Idh/MocA family protein [Pirellulaceae bacterium]
MDRRSFVCTVTCLAFGPAVRSSARGADATPGSQPKLKIGFLGAAYSHAPPKLALLRNHVDFELVGIWDDDAQVRDQVAGQGIPMLSQAEVLSQSDVIAVESVVRDHARYARIALEAGKHVHLEKPPSLEFDDFQAIVQMARQKGLVLQGGYQYRHSPAFNAVMEATHEGWLGDVYMVRATMNNQLAVERRAEWAQYKGGVMYELGSHMVDAIVRLLGKPQKVTPFLYTHGPYGDSLKDNTLAVLEYPRAIATISSATFQPSSGVYRALEVLGTGGTATLRPIEPPTLELDLVRAAGPYRAGKNVQEWPKWERFAGDFAELAAAVRGQRQLTVTPEQEIAIHETLLLAAGMR